MGCEVESRGEKSEGQGKRVAKFSVIRSKSYKIFSD